MTTILIGLAITAMICVVSVVVAQCWYWYEKRIAQWHHDMMLASFADGWDACSQSMKEEK